MKLVLKKTLKIIAIVLGILFFLLVVYLIKCAMGIDIFPYYSLGIWEWFEPYVNSIK